MIIIIYLHNYYLNAILSCTKHFQTIASFCGKRLLTKTLKISRQLLVSNWGSGALHRQTFSLGT